MFAVTYYSETACIFIRLQRLAPGGLFKLNLAPPEAPLSRDREGAVSGATNPPNMGKHSLQRGLDSCRRDGLL